MELREQLLAIGMVLAMLCGGLWLLKRKGLAHPSLRRATRSGEPRMELLDRLALSPQHSLHLVRVGQRTVLVGLSPAGCSLFECASLLPLPRPPEDI